MATVNRNKLNALLARLEPGSPVTSQDLAGMGISANLAVHYVKYGWLTRLARGVFCRPNDTLTLHPCLVMLERKISGLHIGGKSALDLYGVRHYVSQTSMLRLYGWDAVTLPGWFTQRFPTAYHRKRLFKEKPTAMLHVGRFEQHTNGPKVSEPERALLEVLSDVGVRQSLEEARQLTESTYNFRPQVLQELLMHCLSVKTVRLSLMLGRELSLPWMKKLDTAQLPTGSDRPWVTKTDEGLLVLKP